MRSWDWGEGEGACDSVRGRVDVCVTVCWGELIRFVQF